MANKIRVKRGTDLARKGANPDQYEIHYSTQNGDDGRPERLWVTDSSSATANAGDVLIGPYEFVSGDPRIGVTTDHVNGTVSIAYVDEATWNPSQSLTEVASGYSNNSTIEAGDTFNGPHTITVTTGSGANEVKIDRAGFINGAATTYFASPLDEIDNNVLASGSASYSWSQSIATPTAFEIANIATRRYDITVFCDPEQGSGQSRDQSTQRFNWGWRIAGFVSTSAYTSLSLPTASQIVSTSGSNINQFNTVRQTPTSAFQEGFTLPNDGQFWYPYLVHTCSPEDVAGTYEDAFGWTPSATLVGSGSVGLTEITDLAAGDLIFTATNGTQIGGQANAKTYRMWRIGGASGYYGDGSTLLFSFS